MSMIAALDAAIGTVEDESALKPITANEVKDRWKDADKALTEHRRNFWLNLSFYSDSQWVWWDRHRGVLQSLADRQTDNDRVRVTINKIKPRLNNLLGRLTKRNLAFEVQASAADDNVLAGARLAEFVLEGVRVAQDWEEVREENLFNTFCGGTAAVVVDWDGRAGDTLQVDRATGQVVGTGEVRLTPLSITEFSVEPGSRRLRDSRWLIIANAIPPQQAHVLYHLAKDPEADTTADTSPLQRKLLADRGWSDDTPLVTVYTYYEKPTATSPGRVATVIGDQVVEDNEWPYPFDRLPVVVFRQAKVSMRWTGDTLMNAARPVQVGYNAIRSNILEHSKLAGNARMLVPNGVLMDEDLTDEAGEMVRYWPDGSNAKPEWMAPPVIPRWLTQEADRLASELDDIMHTHAVARGEAPGDRNSGLALSVLAEKDDTPIGLTARDQANGWGEIASMVLELYAAKVAEPRRAVVQLQEGSPPLAMTWDGKMLASQTRATVPLDTAMPHSRVAMQAMLTNLKQSFPEQFANLDSSTFLRLLDIPGARLLNEALDDDVALAQVENHLMSQNITAMVEPWHDHGKHIAEMNRHRNSPQFRFYPPEVQQLFELHAQAHQRMQIDEVTSQMALNAVQPGLAATPQAHNPVGSLVPPDNADMRAALGARGAIEASSRPAEPPRGP